MACWEADGAVRARWRRTASRLAQRGEPERHADGVVRITYAARPLALDREAEPAER
ncbi:hypothetical protein [Streptomyces sp. NBC_01235]|uniref:hypothetical protein n=1 Tax=Streptomyces sp. NBC_01235 TaxID=2903788 RepID=UPI002E1567AF|nr:hypothetical protein OG289_46535 [Streptomyces sp. NBC_01235]